MKLKDKLLLIGRIVFFLFVKKLKHLNMKKLAFVISILIFTSSIFAQDKIVEFKLEKKNKLFFEKGLSNGLFYAVTGIEKSPKSDFKIVNYDSDLNIKYERKIQSNYEGLPAFFGRGMYADPIYYDLIPTTTGKYAIGLKDRIVFDEAGNPKDFNFKEEETFGGIEPVFTFYSDNYICYIGNKKQIDKRKSKEPKDENIYLFRRNLDNQTTKQMILNIPKNTDVNEELYYELGSVFLDRFYIITKELNKEKNKDKYTLFAYNYDGKLISSTDLILQLKNKFFTTSNNGFSSTYAKSTKFSNFSSPNYNSTSIQDNITVTTHYLDKDAQGNVYVDLENQFYYVYGLYTYEKDKNDYNSRYNGFYIFKFNFKGDLVWDSEHEIIDKDFNDNSVSYFMDVNFYYLKDNTIGFRISNVNHKYFYMYLLNKSDGKISKERKVEFKIKSTLLYGYKGGSFKTGYQIKEGFGKNNLEKNTIFATFVSPKVEQFFKSKNKDSELNYDCNISEKGIYMIEENVDENKFRLLKFNW